MYYFFLLEVNQYSKAFILNENMPQASNEYHFGNSRLEPKHGALWIDIYLPYP